MNKKIGKRLAAALLCAAILTGGALSAAAAPVPGSIGDAAAVSSQLPSTDDLVKFNVRAQIHSGQRRTWVTITVADNVSVMSAKYYKHNESTYEGDGMPFTFDGNPTVVYDEGLAITLLTFELTLYTPELGSFKVVRTINSFEHMELPGDNVSSVPSVPSVPSM